MIAITEGFEVESKKVVPRKGPVKTLTSTSLKANIPNCKIEARKFEDIAVTLDLPTPKHLRKSDNASTELLKKRAELRTLRVGHRARIRAMVAFIYGIALFLKADKAAWIRFTENEQWKDAKSRPKLKDQNDALRYALRFAVGPKGSAASKRVSKYYLAMVTWFNNDVSAEQVLTKIRLAGGFDALARSRAEQRTKAKTLPKLRPVTAVDVKPVSTGARKVMQSATDRKADLKYEPAQKPNEESVINIAVKANKNTEFLLKAKDSDRLKMSFDVDSVRGRTVNISRVKENPKKQKKAKI